eukprot:2535776-Amphidinium_carterae.1
MGVDSPVSRKKKIQGRFPAVAPLQTMYIGSWNMFEGALPADVGTGAHTFAVHGHVHEGIVPSGNCGIGRLKHPSARVLLGHGLAGTWPGIGGSFHVVSFWGNELEGHLPTVQVRWNSVVLVHSNHLSCKLPEDIETRDIAPRLSMALLGNRFTQPQLRFPAWVNPEEQGSQFCVSNTQGRSLLYRAAASTCIYLLAFDFIFRRRTWAPTSHVLPLLRMWSHSTRVQYLAGLASVHPPAAALSHHGCLQTWIRARDMPFGLAVSQSIVLLSCKQLLPDQLHKQSTEESPNALEAVGCVDIAVFADIITCSTLLCGQVCSWVLALCGHKYAVCLGQLFRSDARTVDLAVVGKLLSTVLVPLAVTVICHAECIGAWTFFWDTCRTADLALACKIVLDESHQWMTARLLSGSDVCGANWNFALLGCTDAALERMSYILYT